MLDIDQTVIPLMHVDNYFNLRKVMVPLNELHRQPYKEVPAWTCSKSILEVVSGIEPEEFYRRVGIDTRKRKAGVMVSTRQCMDLVKLIKTALPIPHLGLLIGKLMTLSHHGQAGIAVMTQDTLADCIKISCRFADRLFPPLKFSYVENQHLASMQFEENIPMGDAFQFFMEIKITSFYYAFKHLIGGDHEPKVINFSFPEPRYSNIYRRHFKCPIQFSSSKTEIVMPASLMKKLLPLANRFIAIKAENTLFESIPIKAITLLPIKLRKLLMSSYGAFPSMEVAAEKLGMSSRTLRRRLIEDGSSYQQVLNNVRAHLAKDILFNRTDSITEIAILLGFSDSSAFTKAFKKWTGLTPRDFRNSHQTDAQNPMPITI